MTPGTLVRLRPDYASTDEVLTYAAASGWVGAVRVQTDDGLVVRFSAAGAPYIGGIFAADDLQAV